LSIKDLTQQLYLGERQIEALESGNLDALPGKTFVRGFVRNYAQAMRMDAAPLLALLDQVPGLQAPRLELPESTHVVMPGQGRRVVKWNKDTLMIAAGLALVLLAAILYMLPIDLFPEKNTPEEQEETLTTLSPEVSITEPAATTPEQATPEAASAVATPPATPASPPPPETPATPATLRFEFERDAWVEVRDKDNKIIFSRTNPPGEPREVTGIPPFQLTIGNATHVRLSYQGQPVALKPDAGSGVARLKLP
jgi:cytoskeleton protein RodZ